MKTTVVEQFLTDAKGQKRTGVLLKSGHPTNALREAEGGTWPTSHAYDALHDRAHTEIAAGQVHDG